MSTTRDELDAWRVEVLRLRLKLQREAIADRLVRRDGGGAFPRSLVLRLALRRPELVACMFRGTRGRGGPRLGLMVAALVDLALLLRADRAGRH